MEKVFSSIAKMNEKELRQVVRAVKERHSFLVTQKVLRFEVGDKVKFKGRWGKTEKGKVTSLNRTTLAVKTDEGVTWRISPSLLTKVGK